MTLGELIAAFRSDMDDKKLPYYWVDDTITRFLNHAETEAARRARLLEDSESPMCLFDVSTDDQFITLDKRIIQVRRVKIASRDQPLAKIHRADLDICFPGWQDATAADTVAYCTDFTRGKVYFVHPFAEDDSITLTVIREPLRPMDDADQEPEISPRYHEALLDWAKHRALLDFDIKEKYDPVAAQKCLDRFEGEFGKKSSAVDEVWIEREQQYDGYDGTF